MLNVLALCLAHLDIIATLWMVVVQQEVLWINFLFMTSHFRTTCRGFVLQWTGNLHFSVTELWRFSIWDTIISFKCQPKSCQTSRCPEGKKTQYYLAKTVKDWQMKNSDVIFPTLTPNWKEGKMWAVASMFIQYITYLLLETDVEPAHMKKVFWMLQNLRTVWRHGADVMQGSPANWLKELTFSKHHTSMRGKCVIEYINYDKITIMSDTHIVEVLLILSWCVFTVFPYQCNVIVI